MTLPPASANSSSILALTSGGAPQPQSSPKAMVPSATSEIRTPVFPKSLYRMRFPQFFGLPTTWIGNDLSSLGHQAQLHQRPADPGSGRARIDAAARRIVVVHAA